MNEIRGARRRNGSPNDDLEEIRIGLSVLTEAETQRRDPNKQENEHANLLSDRATPDERGTIRFASLSRRFLRKFARLVPVQL